MKNPDVTVILPVYNAGPDLASSLLRFDRTLPESSELLIVDDGSTDETLRVVNAFAETRNRVRVIEMRTNGGVAAARNTALASAKGTYIWFVDWDDDWADSILRDLLSTAHDQDADAVVTGARWRSTNGNTLGPVEKLPNERLIDGTRAIEAVTRGELKGYLWTKLLRRKSLPAGMFPAMRSQSDFCGLVSVLDSLGRIAIIPEVRYWHVIREGSITNSKEPNLENLTLCREALVRATQRIGLTERRSRDLLRYDYAHWHLAQIDTALRLSSKRSSRSTLEAVLSRMRWRDILSISRHDLRTGLHSGLVKVAGLGYPGVRTQILEIRSRVRRLKAEHTEIASRGVK